MKKMCTIFTTLLLMPYCTTWSMLMQTQKSQKALAYRTQLRKQALHQENEQLKILADNSITFQNQLEDMPDTSIKVFFNNLIRDFTTKKTLNAVAQLYASPLRNPIPASELKDKTTQDLVDMINLATYLDMKTIPTENRLEPQEVLKQSLLTKIENEKISELQPVVNLNSNRAAEILLNFIKTNKIDIKLVKPYNQFLIANPKETPDEKQKHQLTNFIIATKELLFFNDKIKIYGAYSYHDIRTHGSTRFTKLLINNEQNQEAIDLLKEEQGYYFDPNLSIVNSACSFCIATYSSSNPLNLSFELINLATTEKENLDQKITSCCFDQNNHLYTIDYNGFINTVDLNKKTNHPITQLELFNELPHSITSNSTGSIIAVATDNHLFIIKNNSNIIKQHKKEIFEGLSNDNNNQTRIGQLSINHKGSTLCITTQTPVSQNPHRVYLYNLTQNQSKTFEITSKLIGSDHLLKTHETVHLLSPRFTWEDTDSLLLTRCNYQYEEMVPGSISMRRKKSRYAFTIPYSANTWTEQAIHKNITASQNGTQAILPATYFYPYINLITFCDDNMTTALNYLDAAKPLDGYSYNQRLLGTILLYTIFKKGNPVQLDTTEMEIYNNLPNEIKNILTTRKTQQEQSAQSSLRNKLFYGAAAAIGATAAYKWWTGNK